MLFRSMTESKSGLASAIQKLGFVAVGAEAMRHLAEQLIAENPDLAQQIRDGNAKAIGALIGKARKLNPNANPGVLKTEIQDLLI